MKGFFAIIIIASIILTGTAYAQEEIEYVNATLFKGPFDKIFQVEDYVYCAGDRLHILAVRDTTNLVLVDYLDYKILDMAYSTGFAFMATADSSLQVFSVIDPGNPYIVAGLDLLINHLFLSGHNLYATLPDYGFAVIDVSNPLSPILSGFCETATGQIAIQGNYAFISAGLEGISIIDITDSNNPTFIRSIETDYSALTIFASEEYLYLGSAYSIYPFIYGRMSIYDIADPLNPILLDSEEFLSTPELISVDSPYAFLLSSYRLSIWNISDPSNPILVGEYFTSSGHAFWFIMDESLVFIASDDPTIRILDVSDPAAPQVVGLYDTGAPTSICIRDSTAYVGNAYFGSLKTLNISVPSQPRILGSCLTDGVVNNLEIADDYAFLADTYFKVLDISDPADPQIIWDNNFDYIAYDIFISETYAFVAYKPGSLHGLRILDVSDAANPVDVGYYPVNSSGGCLSIQVVENYAYLIDSRIGLLILDISDISSPQLIGTYNVVDNMASDVSVHGSYAYITIWEEGLEIIDLSNPTAPDLIGSCTLPRGSQNIKVYGNYAYVASMLGGIQIIDISDPVNPFVVASHDSESLALRISVYNNYIFLADFVSLMIFYFDASTGTINEVSKIPHVFALAPNFPNPFNASTAIRYDLPVQSDVLVEIYDLLGRKIETVISGVQPAGSHSVIWNAEDVSSGVYFYRIEAGDFVETRKCVLLK